MIIKLGELTTKGKVRACGVSVKKPCKDRFGAKNRFGGSLTPASQAQKGQIVTRRLYRKKGTAWQLTRTLKVKLAANKSFLWISGARKLARGNWYVQSSVAATTTTKAATSTRRYVRVL